GKLEYVEGSAKLPYGHGYATAQLKKSLSAFKLTKAGAKRQLKTPVLDLLIRRGVRYVGTHRVNDLTKFLVENVDELQGSVLEIDKLAYAIYQIEENNRNVVVELVENPAGQKGGNMFEYVGKQFLVETLNAKGVDKLRELFDKAGELKTPYNAFRLIYDAKSLGKLLDKGLPYNLRFKDGYFYLEAVTGDITQLEGANVVGYKKAGELIHDFKELKNLEEAIKYLDVSDNQLKVVVGDPEVRKRISMSNFSFKEVMKILQKFLNVNTTISSTAGSVVSKQNWLVENANKLSGKSIVIIGETLTEDVLSRIQLYKNLGFEVVVITKDILPAKFESSKNVVAEYKGKKDIYKVDVYNLEGIPILAVDKEGLEFGRVALSCVLDLIGGDNGLLGKEFKGRYNPAVVEMVGEQGVLSYYDLLDDIYRKDYSILFNKLVWMYVGDKEQLSLRNVEEEIKILDLYKKEGKIDLSRVYDYANILKFTHNEIITDKQRVFILQQIYPTYLQKLEIARQELKWFGSEAVKMLKTKFMLGVSLRKVDEEKLERRHIDTLGELYKTYISRGISGIVMSNVEKLSFDELMSVIDRLKNVRIKGIDVKGMLMLKLSKEEFVRFAEKIKEIAKNIDGIIVEYDEQNIDKLLDLRKYKRDLELIMYNVAYSEVHKVESLGIKVANVVSDEFDITKISTDRWYLIPRQDLDKIDNMKKKAVGLVMLGVDGIVLPEVNTGLKDLSAMTFKNIEAGIEEIISYTLNITKRTTESAYIEGYYLGKSMKFVLDRLGVEKRNELVYILKDAMLGLTEEFREVVNTGRAVDVNKIREYLNKIISVQDSLPLYVSEVQRIIKLLETLQEKTQQVLLLSKLYGMAEGLIGSVMIGIKYKDLVYELKLKDEIVLSRLLLMVEEYIRRDKDGNIVEVVCSDIDKLVVLNSLTEVYPKEAGRLQGMIESLVEKLVNTELSFEQQLILVGIIGEQHLTGKYKEYVNKVLNITLQQAKQDIKLKFLHYWASIMNGLGTKVMIDDSEISLYGVKTEEKANMWLKLLFAKAKHKEYEIKDVKAKQVLENLQDNINPLIELVIRETALSDIIDLETQKFISLKTEPKTVSDLLILFDLLIATEYVPLIRERNPTVISVEEIKKILGAV
ncbi:MAG: hypothetical protein N2555_01365, partial [Endomicrobia bacterium]|nr:hypothetical protein [Endomicrobiia bacterium]